MLDGYEELKNPASEAEPPGAADWAIRFYEKHGFRLLPDGDALLRTYWHIPARQRETSVVLGRKTGG